MGCLTKSLASRYIRICVLILCGISLRANVSANPLETARTLANSKFKGWSYGADPKKQEIDCVQFILAVVEAELKSTLGQRIRDAILIKHGWTDSETQLVAAAGEDRRLGGVAYALAELGKLGSAVRGEDVKPGDFVQYW